MGLIDGDTVPCLVCGKPMTIRTPCCTLPEDDERWNILVHNTIAAARPAGPCEAATQLVEAERLEGKKI